jgi:predicted enzyme related to lactoylglutathione lyase
MPPVFSYPAGTPCWFDLVATDREAARDFYGELFGWSFTEGRATESPYLVARIGGLTVAGISVRTDDGPAPGWLTYLACPDAGSLNQRVAAAGATMLTPFADEAGDGAVATVRDVQGAVFGAWRGGRVAGAQLVGEPGAPFGADLLTSDLQAAISFYRSLFPYDVQFDGGSRATLGLAGRMAASITTVPASGSSWRPCFAVDDLDRLGDRARSLGADVRVEVDRRGARPRALVSDPQGAVFVLMEPPRQPTRS